MEFLWKVAKAIIDTRPRPSVRLHDVLHGFLTGRGTGTTVLDMNMAQELESMDQVPLFLVILDL